MNSLCGIALGGSPPPPRLSTIAVASIAAGFATMRLSDAPRRVVTLSKPYVFEISPRVTRRLS